MNQVSAYGPLAWAMGFCAFGALENGQAPGRDSAARSNSTDGFSASLRYQLTRALPRILPCGLPPAVSRAVALTAWVTGPIHDALSRWF
jgi:hypothetical protein